MKELDRERQSVELIVTARNHDARPVEVFNGQALNRAIRGANDQAVDVGAGARDGDNGWTRLAA